MDRRHVRIADWFAAELTGEAARLAAEAVQLELAAIDTAAQAAAKRQRAAELMALVASFRRSTNCGSADTGKPANND